MDAKEFFESLDFDNKDYFYHITKSGIGEYIFEEGLLMAESKLITTTVKITKEMIKDIDEFINREKGQAENRFDFREEMVIIGCDKEDTENLVDRNYYISKHWEAEEQPKYCIPSEYIIGYINMIDNDYNFEVIMNPNYYDYGYSK